MTQAVKKMTEKETAPDFELPADNGQKISLSQLRGKKVVLYFYPKADTSGCTIEAIAFSSLVKEFNDINTTILGISADSVKAQCKFRDKHNLTTLLLSDETHEMLERYGVWVEKSMYGKKYMGIERTTILIDKEGKIARIWPKVKIEGHAEEVLKVAREL